MDLFELETFLAVAQERSFSRAAQRLHRTQPAISQAIRKLESEIGEPLFDRSSRAGKLTDAGHVLETYAQELLNLRKEAEVAITELRQLQNGKLTIAANEFTCLYLLPVLDQFRHIHPLVKVTVQRTLASHLAQEVINHGAELGILSFDPQDSQLQSIVVYRDQLAFVVHPKHPLAERKQITIGDLAAEVFIAHNVASPYRAKVVEAFRRHRTPLNMDVQLPSIEAIKKFVGMGNGVALVPGICVDAEVKRGELVRIPVTGLTFERKLRIVYRRHANLSHAARAFLRVAQSVAQEAAQGYTYQQQG